MATRPLLVAGLLLACCALASGCLVTQVGSKTCTSTNCAVVTGYWQDATSGSFHPLPGPPIGGINYEFYTALLPTDTVKINNVVKPVFQMINQVAATSYSQCCSKCAQTADCQFFRYFPQSDGDQPAATMASGCPTGYSKYSPPYPSCPFTTSSYCTLTATSTAYNPADGTKPCILVRLNSNTYKSTSGGTCTPGPSVPNCFPQVSDVSSAHPAYETSINSRTCLPKSCGTPRSYWGGSCNPSVTGTAKDDPHFLGGDGVRFEFNGEIGRSFCLITDKHLHVNMELGGYLDNRTYGAGILKDGKAVRSWITGLTFMWKDTSGVQHSLLLKARRGKQQERGTGFLDTLLLDGAPAPVPSQVGDRIEASGLLFAMEEPKQWGQSTMDQFSLQLEGFSATIGTRVAHPLLRTPDEAYAHFNIRVNSFHPTDEVHGVLGQTFRSDASRLVRMLEYKLLATLLRKPVQADGESGVGYLDGNMQDYQTSAPDAADCKFSSAWLQ